MILSRFWYLLLTGAALMGFAAALLTQGLVNHHYQTAVVNDLVRDRFEVEQTLRIDARSRLDAAGRTERCRVSDPVGLFS